MVSILQLISNSSSSFSRFLGTVLSTQPTIGITFILSFFQFSGKVQVFVYLFAFYSVIYRNSQIHFTANSLSLSLFLSLSLSLFCHSTQGLVFWFGLGDAFVSQSPKVYYGFHSLGVILVCANIIWQYGQVSLSCTIPQELPFPLSHTSSFTPLY